MGHHRYASLQCAGLQRICRALRRGMSWVGEAHAARAIGRWACYSGAQSSTPQSVRCRLSARCILLSLIALLFLVCFGVVVSAQHKIGAGPYPLVGLVALLVAAAGITESCGFR